MYLLPKDGGDFGVVNRHGDDVQPCLRQVLGHIESWLVGLHDQSGRMRHKYGLGDFTKGPLAGTSMQARRQSLNSTIPWVQLLMPPASRCGALLSPRSPFILAMHRHQGRPN